MAFEVRLTRDAERDLEDLLGHVAAHDAPGKADQLLDRLEEVISSLAAFPERGTHPKELLELGIREYRQVFFKPYRLIYRLIGKRVYIYLLADDRRDMQTLLTRRLVSG